MNVAANYAVPGHAKSNADCLIKNPENPPPSGVVKSV